MVSNPWLPPFSSSIHIIIPSNPAPSSVYFRKLVWPYETVEVFQINANLAYMKAVSAYVCGLPVSTGTYTVNDEPFMNRSDG
jgi:hypothetical protein